MLIVWAMLLFPWNLSAQYYQWSDPFAISDSVADNSNPYLHHTGMDMEEKVFMVWERSNDSSSTEIWMDNILDEEPAFVVLAENGIHYTHPKIMGNSWGSSYGDIQFFILYQTDEAGNQDIHVIPYMADGTFSESFPLANTVSNECQLSVSREMFYDGTAWIQGLASWIGGDDLYACFLQKDGSSYYFEDPVLIDSGGCSAPSVNLYEYYGMLYCKSNDTTSYICRASYNSEWNPPEIYFDSLRSMNPTAASYYGNPGWTVKTDTGWKVMIEEWNDYGVYELSSPDPFDPAMLGVFFGVKSWFPEVYVAVEYRVDSITEIYMTEEMGSGNFINFSNSGTMNRHPQFFLGETDPYNYWCWYNYIAWESFRNGHWQIWAAKYIMCGGGIEDEDEKTFARVFPNPFDRETIIEFTLETQTSITAYIFERNGRYLTTIADRSFPPGTHQLHWNAEHFAPGMYLLRIEAGEKTYTSKLIKN